MHIGFLIRGLDIGGSERQLLNLAEGLAQRGHQITIYTFYSGVLDSEVKKSRLLRLGKKSRWDLFVFFRLRSAVKSQDFFYSFLPTQNIFASLAGLRSGTKIVWGIRAAEMPLHFYSWRDRLIYFLQTILCFQPSAIIFNSEAGRIHHQEKFYFRVHSKVLRNGVDTSKFSKTEGPFRQSLGIDSNTFLIGYVGRLDPVKDHRLFFLTLQDLKKRGFKFHAVILGDGPLADELKKLAELLDIKGHIQFIEKYNPMAEAYSAFDLTCLFSLSEGCPNVVAEAMACETPCLVTSEAGDGPWLVGNSDFVGESRSPQHLADKIQNIAANWKKEEGVRLRLRVQTELSLDKLVSGTEHFLKLLT